MCPGLRIKALGASDRVEDPRNSEDSMLLPHGNQGVKISETVLDVTSAGGP